MDYRSVADNVSSKFSSMNSYLNSFNVSSLDSIWSGDAPTSLTNNLNEAISNINKQKSNIDNFSEALNLLAEYKENKEKINFLIDNYNSYSCEEEDLPAKKSLFNEINRKQSSNYKLRKRINGLLNSVSSSSKQFKVVNYQASDNEAYKEYVVNLNELVSMYNSNNLSTMSSSGGSSELYDYYSREEVVSRLDEIKKHYTGRDAAVNCTLSVMEMAASVGKKLDYNWDIESKGVSSTTTDKSFASWAVNQATGLSNITSSDLINSGVNTSYEEAQKGDILVYDNGNNGHVAMIVDNNPDSQEFILVESADDTGVVVKSKSYASLTGTYQAKDLSGLYKE